MRVLVVLKDVPLHEGSAPAKTSVGLLQGLLAHGLDVRAVAARQPFSPRDDPPATLPVEVVPVGPAPPPTLRRRLDRLLRPRADLARGAFADRVREAAAEADVVHLEEAETLWTSPGDGSCLHVHYLVSLDRPQAGPWQREGRDRLELALLERAVLRRQRCLIASSPVVAAELRRRAPRAEVALAPLTLDPAHYARAALAEPVAGLIGTAAWPTTAAAARRLVRNVWPLVRRAVPGARLRVAGRGMESLVAGADGVEVVGEVPSAAEFLSGLSVLLFPLDRGSGVKVKTLESIASGVPVVTTRHGAEGIEAVVVAETDGDLARAAASVLADEAERRERGSAGRLAFEERYAPVPATAPLVDLYRRRLGLR